MPIADDFSITGLDIRHIAGTTTYTGIEFHRFLMDLANDLEYVGDDMVDITYDTPSKRKGTDNYIELLNGYNIDDATSEWLYDASIVQNSGADIYDSIVNYGTAGIYFDIIQAGALLTNFWGAGLNADASKGISHRFLIKVRAAGADIDGRRLIGINREFGYSYGEFVINGTSRGNNTLALKHSIDLNNDTAAATVAAFVIANTEGYQGLDVDADGTPEYYFSKYDRGAQSINDLYEYLKWQGRRGTAETVYGISGALFRGITHDITLTAPLGTFAAVEAVSWTGGTGQMFAIDSTTAGTHMWVQVLTGVAPVNGQTITGASTATAVADVITEHSIKGSISTGSALIGGYGVGLLESTLTKDDKLMDLSGVTNTPPNSVTYTVSNLLAGDTVLVGKKALIYDETLPGLENKIDVSQFGLAAATLVDDVSVQIDQAIPDDTPTSGTFRVFDGTTYKQVTYTGWAVDTFTGCTGTPAAALAANLWVSYLDGLATGTTMAFTGFHTGADLDLFIRVRAGGASPIEEFKTTGKLTASGGSVTVIRTSDT